MENADLLLKWLCVSVGQKLRLPNEIESYWDDLAGGELSAQTYFQQYILPQLSEPLVLSLDNIDCVFSYPDIAEEFLGFFRRWYEDGKSNQLMGQMRLIFVHSIDAYIPLNVNTSPFNVGLHIPLPDFNLEQIVELASRYNLTWNDSDAKQLMAIVGGHPFLVHLAIYYIACTGMNKEEIFQQTATGKEIYSSHLRQYLVTLQKQPELTEIIKLILSGTSVTLNSEEVFRLSGMGLVSQDKEGRVSISCELYRRYFSEQLLK